MYSSVPPKEDPESARERFTSDFVYLRAEHAQPWWRTWSTLAKVLGAASVVLLLILVIVGFSRPPRMEWADECLHALGGGESTRGGGFDVAIVKTDRCKHVLHAYLKRAYWHEVDLAAGRALEYFKAAPPAGPNDTIVFDIDETALSNIDEFTRSMRAGRPLGKPLQHAAPAIAAVREVYLFLYAANYTVTFLTGRGESDREHTAANLNLAGYGIQCGVDGNGQVVRTQDEPCWLQLDLRAAGDTRLASVYKPDKRGQLMQRGFRIVGSFGDQFSDLSGENSATASFKLPNPMYYIL